MLLLLFPFAAGSSFQACWADDCNELVFGMKKNVASQVIGVQMVTAADGTAFTGAVSVFVTGDAGAQGAGAGTAPAHEGNGCHTYTPTQAETNYNHIAFTFTGTGAIPKTVQVYTQFPQTGDSYAEVTSGTYGLSVIESLVDDIGAAGAGLTAVPWNAAWDAEVQSEVEDALIVHRLDELLNADSDIDGAAPPTVGSVFHELMTKTAGSFTYDQTTDALEAIRDNMGTAQTGDAFARLGAPAGASVSADIATVDTVVDAVKVQTDKFVFTVANNVNANIQYVNDVLVTGTGAAGDEWGP